MNAIRDSRRRITREITGVVCRVGYGLLLDWDTNEGHGEATDLMHHLYTHKIQEDAEFQERFPKKNSISYTKRSQRSTQARRKRYGDNGAREAASQTPKFLRQRERSMSVGDVVEIDGS